MDRKSLISLVALIFIIAGVGLYLGLRPSPVKAPAHDVSTIANPYTESGAYYDIVANYPTTTPLMGPANESAVASMQAFIIDSVSQFKKDGNFDNLTPSDIKTLGFGQGRTYSLEILYLISSSPHTASYIFTTSEDTGGAHPNTFFRTFTFNKDVGKELALADLFIPGSDYLGMLSSIARTKLPQIIGPLADTNMIKEGTVPVEKNFKNFFIDNGTLDILFDPYAVAAYAAGPQTLQIPLKDLSGILKSEYRP